MRELRLDKCVKLLGPSREFWSGACWHTENAGTLYAWEDEPAKGYLTVAFYQKFNVQWVRLYKPEDGWHDWLAQRKKEGWIESDFKI